VSPLAAGPEFSQVFAATSVLPCLLLLAGLPLALVAAARAGRALAAVDAAAAASPLGSFLAGLGGAAAILLLLAASSTARVLGLAAVLALGVAAIVAFLGLAAEARDLGARLRGRPAAGAGGGSLALGWVVLAGVPLLPVAGPLALLYLGLRAGGAALLALARPAPRGEPAAA
jgi:hypothetical protein